MGWNDAYWNGKQDRIKKAKEHHKKMVEVCNLSIEHSVKNTEIWDDTRVSASLGDINTITGSPAITIENLDTVSAIFKYGQVQRSREFGKIAVLNFASYKNPGGGFLEGSGAQEEALCHESILYEVLSHPTLASFYEWNNQNKNKALYLNRGLYSKDIVFERNEAVVKADVITVAAPNKRTYMGYAKNASVKENDEALRSRIRFIKDIAVAHMTNDNLLDQPLDAIVLGAFGCGVFGQDPELVARFFKETFANVPIKIIYAVIDKGGHHKDGNYEAFKRNII